MSNVVFIYFYISSVKNGKGMEGREIEIEGIKKKEFKQYFFLSIYFFATVILQISTPSIKLVYSSKNTHNFHCRCFQQCLAVPIGVFHGVAGVACHPWAYGTFINW